LIGHLQKNKVKYIAPFIHLIHSVDSIELLDKINREAEKNNRKISVLLQYRIAKEETKFGLTKTDLFEAADFCLSSCPNINLKGLMGMASFSDDEKLVRSEFQMLKKCFNELREGRLSHIQDFNLKSMGMSGDYKLALEEDSNMLRIGTLLFGERPSV
jgi:pyridoxal phosphate enzyme (YggS family)